jgi:aminoglycoside phosphotransferase family enzyme/predicted kinase
MSESLPAWLVEFQIRLGARLVETHISWVLIAEDCAFKIKKPVVLSYLDYGTADRRLFFCREELRLNQRLAAEFYLDVVPVADSGEWAVRMRSFKESQRLDHVCDRGELTREHIVGLARALVAFHNSAPVAATTEAYGTPDRVADAVMENFSELDVFLPAAGRRLEALAASMRSECVRLCAAIAARKAAGWVRECHGDLHLGNMVLLDGKAVPFDCIEFNEDFRFIDVASELAFVFMDLVCHRRPELALCLLDEWLTWSGDFDAVPLLRFYAAYRAMVRAKIAGMRGEHAVALDYLRTAEALHAAPPPRLTIMVGVSGSGKSVASMALLSGDPTASTLRLRSDVERKRLYGLTALESSGTKAADLYSAQADARTYARLAMLAGSLLDSGWSVIVDATFLRREDRRAFHAIAQARAAGFSIHPCTAPLDSIRQRVSMRAGDASEATLDVLERQMQSMEPLDDEEVPLVVPGVRPSLSRSG